VNAPTGDIDVREVDRIVEAAGRDPAALVPILRGIQEHFHYLPRAALRRVCERTDITPAAVAGVATFYSQFRQQPAGRHTVQVCVGTACHVKGAPQVIDRLKRHLAIAEGEDTDPTKLFTVGEVACLGCCMLAPVLKIDEVTYGQVDAVTCPRLLRDFLQSQAGPAAAERVPAPSDGAAAGTVSMCLCSSCRAAGAWQVFREAEKQVEALDLPLTVTMVGCTGASFEAPAMEMAVGGGTFRYGRVRPEQVRSLLLRHVRPPRPAGRWKAAASGWLEKLLTDEAWEPVTRYLGEPRAEGWDDRAGAQVRLATEGAGRLHPLDLEGYRRAGGFEALDTCRTRHSPEQVVALIHDSGLRGRGGAGYAAALKWDQVRRRDSPVKYVICNGDEGDPGAFMDRMLLESFPFRVIEGMAVAACAVGAREGYFYIRGEYPLAASRVREAIRICDEEGLLGADTLQLKVVEGAGAFVCGEETALIEAMEGRRGMPRFRPPYPAERGLRGRPTLINNVETLALVPWIVRRGPEAFASIGTEASPGTKTFALAGKILRGGLIEVPMGTTLRRIVEDIGGGVPGGRSIKAVQIGGPSGGCVPAAQLDTPVDYHALSELGSIMGSGGLVVLDDSDCMVDVARYFLRFTQAESCGKCTHCRVGTLRMLEILERLCEGAAREDDLDRLEELVRVVPQGSLCGLGKTAPHPVASALRHFRGEFEAHLQRRCPARKCKPLIRYRIADACIGCTRCAQHCPADAIAMTPYEVHVIDADRCIRCDTCRQVCPSGAVEVE
jgi:NADH-quinone oxidoreductase subunit F